MLFTNERSRRGGKEEFYEVLQNTMKNRFNREIIVLMGDFNAKVGNENTGYREMMGGHGVGDMNENGQLLPTLCQQQISYWWNFISS